MVLSGGCDKTLNRAAVPRPWILIPVHHRRELTLRCLRHLRATQGDAGATVAVIEAASSDGTAEAVRREFPEAQLLSVSADHWWTGAIARGMQAADADGATTVLWLNDDCLPDSGCIARLLLHAGGAEPTVAGAVCRDEAGRPVPTAFSGRTTYSAPPAGAIAMQVEGLSGFCVAVPRAAWTAVGFPDAIRFPHYCGDTAFTLAAGRAGVPVRLDGTASAQLVPYRERAHTVGDYVRRLPLPQTTWAAVFLAPGSPFRAATHMHYLRLRYGLVAGTMLAAGRVTRWQLAFIAAATGAGRGSAAGP